MRIERFEDLEAWKEARRLMKIIYAATQSSAFQADRDLVRQMRRAATSAMSNIAEGFSRYSFKDSKQFYMLGRGSLSELRSHIYIAGDQRYLSAEEARDMRERVECAGRLVSGLIRNARKQLESGALDVSVGTNEPLNQ